MSIIDFVFEKGNSFHPTDVLNRGVGGNELTIISWAEELVKLGNKVNLFVKGGSNYFYNGVNWYEYNAWNNQAEADVLIDVRGIDTLKKNKQYNKKYLFLGDRVTPNFEKACKERIFDYLICVSQYQKNLYLKQLHRQYHPETLILQCGIDDKLLDFPFNKIPYRIVHASAPYRGLKGVLQMWPAIKKTIAQLIERPEFPAKDEIRPVYGANINDLSPELIKSYLIDRGQSLKIPSPELWKYLHDNEFLSVRSEDGSYVPTYAGLLLLGKNPENYLPNFKIKALCFDRESEEYTPLENLRFPPRDICGPLSQVVEESVTFVLNNVRKVPDIQGIEMVEVPE
jgi:hypothetical protein